MPGAQEMQEGRVSRGQTRSQRRLQKRLDKAVEARERKLDKGELSLESGLGRLVIIVSGRTNFKNLYIDRAKLGKETEYYWEEAERLKAERAKDHQQVLIRRRAVPREMKLDFADPEVTDIMLIGHGNISSIWADPQGYFTWHQAAKSASRLKQGRIEQRMCGDFTPALPYHVPLGTFAVSRLSNVTAAAGMIVPDIDPSDALFTPIYSDEGDVLQQIDDLNERYSGEPVVVT